MGEAERLDEDLHRRVNLVPVLVDTQIALPGVKWQGYSPHQLPDRANKDAEPLFLPGYACAQHGTEKRPYFKHSNR